MHNDGNVVPLHKASTDQANRSPLARLPVILLQVRDKAAQQLRLGLQGLFDNADDTLFEMADRARNDVEQNLYFEAMRDLRLKRKSIEREFIEQFFEAFVSLAQYDLTQATLAPAQPQSSRDDLERHLAVEAMVTRVLSRDGTSLEQLTARLSVLLARPMNNSQNPLSPALLCENFLQAGRNLGVEIKVKLILLKLFERYVLSECDQLYAEANQLLAATGILPDLKISPSRRASDRIDDTPQPPPEKAARPKATEVDDSVQEVFAALQKLLAQVRGSVAPTLEPSAPAQPISTRDLLRLLSHLQQYVPAPTQQDEFDLRSQLEQLLTRVSVKSGKSRVVEGADEDVINLISMMFEFILEDHNLPESLKALIGRLQIPMLKVAVQDKSFFSRGNHPARRLLNEIADAAMGWGDCDDYQRDSLYLRIEQVVQRLLNDFVDDPAIFSEVLADFLAFANDERRRSELLEQRIRDAEEGRAKAELARLRVEGVLNQVMLGKTLPLAVVEFVQHAWSQVLLLTGFKHGDASAEWRADVLTLEQLIWSVQYHDEPDAGLRLLAMVPELLKALREGLSRSAFDPFATSEFFSELEILHVQALQRMGQATEQAQSSDSPEMIEVKEKIVLRPPHKAPADSAAVRLPADDVGLRQVDQLRLGSWVEFQEDEENSLRCKLAAIIEATGKYIFVNRTGLKVQEHSRTSLALEFRRGAARVLDDTLLFDRALESVLGNLRQLNRGK